MSDEITNAAKKSLVAHASDDEHIAYALGYRDGKQALEEKLSKAIEALEKIRNARYKNPNKEMGDLLLFQDAVANEALAQVRERLGDL